MVGALRGAVAAYVDGSAYQNYIDPTLDRLAVRATTGPTSLGWCR